MDSIQVILQVAAVVTAITTICVAAKKVISLVKKIADFIHRLDSSVDTLLKHDNAQYKAILRLTITADHMPMSERLLAGKEYVEELGGNGEVKALYNELKAKCEAVND